MQRFKILIVEDDQILREIMRHILAEHNFLIEEAASSEEALEKITSNVPHLIVLDNDLPYKKGVDLYKILKKMPHTQKIPLIFCTGDDLKEIQKQLSFSPEYYFEKPFDYNLLIVTINRILSTL